ncbi:MAG: bifunctional (p)ppGpp synthetase/guanosine-3',5'-bis(diphosphate) 3'-pyrophosphohydrolase [Rickettsia sp.]|jgi:GTP pyrophosphokinase|nr:bifunctional (p)ppGpp synthetase/guanosine-3',5'-bis(diphosphate) 3'-pyrophosphohydrolase [Rickettsia sp.]
MQDQDTKDLHKIVDIISTKLSENVLVAKIYYRLKDPCSTLNKMFRKSKSLQELNDLVAFRIIVDRQEYCYKALDIISNIFFVKIKKTKNYIDHPKDNGYRSLHTIAVAVIGMYDRNIEIQIRTSKMHDIAEFGTAKHGDYKRKQEAKISKLFLMGLFDTPNINTELNKVYDLFNQFNWTIPELIAYEQAIENLWHNFQKKLEI